ncbi:mCG148128 [Mus musculus]|nr:mCG148128 [Mus musculus]
MGSASAPFSGFCSLWVPVLTSFTG